MKNIVTLMSRSHCIRTPPQASYMQDSRSVPQEEEKATSNYQFYYGKTEKGTVTFLADHVVTVPSEEGVENTAELKAQHVKLSADKWHTVPFQCEMPAMSTNAIQGVVDFEEFLDNDIYFSTDSADVQPNALRGFLARKNQF